MKIKVKYTGKGIWFFGSQIIKPQDEFEMDIVDYNSLRSDELIVVDKKEKEKAKNEKLK